MTAYVPHPNTDKGYKVISVNSVNMIDEKIPFRLAFGHFSVCDTSP